MASENLDRIVDAARSVGATHALLTAPDDICATTTWPVPIEVGPSPFAGGPPIALLNPDSTLELVVDNQQRADAEAHIDRDQLTSVHDYSGYTATDPLAGLAPYADAVHHLCARLGAETVAVDLRSLPAIVDRKLRQAGATVIDARQEFDRARAYKTDAELVALARSGAVAARGHRLLREILAAAEETSGTLTYRGHELTELSLFGLIRTGMECQAGERVALGGDLVAGARRTAAVGGWPEPILVRPDEPVIADLGPRVDGYWADSASTWCRKPSDELRAMYAAVARALDAGAAALRPGIPACDVHGLIKAEINAAGYDYPHHSGHGIGAAVHEFPRIVPGERAPLAERMVILLEPGAYGEAGGVRLEYMYEITATGARRLTEFEYGLVP